MLSVIFTLVTAASAAKLEHCVFALDAKSTDGPLTAEHLVRAERQVATYLGDLEAGRLLLPRSEIARELLAARADQEWLAAARALIEAGEARFDRVRSLAAGGLGRRVDRLATFSEADRLGDLRPERWYAIGHEYEVKWSHEVHDVLFAPETRATLGRTFVTRLLDHAIEKPRVAPCVRVRLFERGLAHRTVAVCGDVQDKHIDLRRVESYAEETARLLLWELLQRKNWRAEIEPRRGYVLGEHPRAEEYGTVAFGKGFVRALLAHPDGQNVLVTLANFIDHDDKIEKNGRVAIENEDTDWTPEDRWSPFWAKGRRIRDRLFLTSFGGI